MTAKIKTNDKVRFTARGKTYVGRVVNAAYYPGGARSGKHIRINVNGMTATIFANGEVGKSIKKVSA